MATKERGAAGRFSERTQISLTKEERMEIDAIATALGISMSEVVRRGVDMLVASTRKDRRFQQAVLRRTAGAWKSKGSGLEYERKLREEEETRLKRSGLA